MTLEPLPIVSDTATRGLIGVAGNSSAMRISTSPGFSMWLLRVNHRFPFDQLRVTRNGFSCKYVILEDHNKDLSCVRADTLQVPFLEALISQAACRPLPPDMTGIIDHMVDRGRSSSPSWYRAVVSMLWEMLDGTHPCEREDIFMECIYWLVKERITESYDMGSFEGQMLIDAFDNYSIWRYSSKLSFKDWSMMCEEFVTQCMDGLQLHGGLPPAYAAFVKNPNNQPLIV